jgi:hypothetical protein
MYGAMPSTSGHFRFIAVIIPLQVRMDPAGTSIRVGNYKEARKCYTCVIRRAMLCTSHKAVDAPLGHVVMLKWKLERKENESYGHML